MFYFNTPIIIQILGSHLQYPLSTILVKKPVASEITDLKYRTEVCDAVIGQIKNGTLFGAELKLKSADNYLKPCLKNGLTDKKYRLKPTTVNQEVKQLA